MTDAERRAVLDSLRSELARRPRPAARSGPAAPRHSTASSELQYPGPNRLLHVNPRPGLQHARHGLSLGIVEKRESEDDVACVAHPEAALVVLDHALERQAAAERIDVHEVLARPSLGAVRRPQGPRRAARTQADAVCAGSRRTSSQYRIRSGARPRARRATSQSRIVASPKHARSSCVTRQPPSASTRPIRKSRSLSQRSAAGSWSQRRGHQERGTRFERDILRLLRVNCNGPPDSQLG